MKCQNPSMHSSKHAMHQKVCNAKMPKLLWAIPHEVFFRIYSEVNQVIYSSISIYSPGFKALAPRALEIFC